MSQGSNYFKYEDSKGFMWLTGNDALNRFDGKMIKVYNLNKYFKDCPNLQQGYGFAEDDKSNIYIGSIRGIYIYHRDLDKFTLQKIFLNEVDNVAMPFGFRNGKIWCFNRQFQICTYDVKTKEVKYITKPKLMPLISTHIYQLNGNLFYHHFPFIDNYGTIWLISNNDIAGYNIANKTTIYPLEESIKQQKTTFYCSSYDKQNNVLLCGTNNGLLEYNISTNKLTSIKSIAGKKIEIINSLDFSKDFIAIRSVKLGIIFCDKKFKKAFYLEKDGPEKYARCYGFDFDKNHRLWMCDDGYGEIIFDFKSKLLNKEPSDAFDTYKIKSGITSFAELPNGNILVRYDLEQNKKTKKITYFPVEFPYTMGLRCSIDKYRKGVWLFEESFNIEHQTRRVFYYNGNLKNKKPELIFEQKNIDQLGQQLDLKVLKDGKVMCSFAKGLFWLDVKNKSLEKVKGIDQINPFTINLLSDNRIAIAYLNNDMIIAKLMPDNSLQILKKILHGVQTFYLQENTNQQQYWIGTNKGVYLFDKNFKQLKLFDPNNGLAGNYIYGILIDNQGNVWCSHQRGLSSINAKTFQIINYDKSDGIQDWDYNNRAFYKTTDGTLYFGGAGGFNYFKPPLTPTSFYKPEVYIDEILINNLTYSEELSANYITKLQLQYNENNISIKAIVKDLVNANSKQIIYRLKGIDRKWKYLPNNSIIQFNSLEPNNYTLQLGTYDKYTNREIVQKTILISIAYPFYSKIWFLVITIIIGTSLIFLLYYRRRLAKQKYVFGKQLALELQRNKITADLHDDIGASLSSLQINSAVASQLIHKNIDQTKQILEKIETQSKNIAEKIGDIIWSMKPGKDEFMTMSSRIKNFANDILSATNIQYSILIDKEIDTVIKDITYRKNIVLITKEAINNAVKYSNASQLMITLKVIEELIILEISDNGIGFEISKTNGNGIANMKRRVVEIKGSFSINSIPNEGTTILVKMPLKQNLNIIK